MASLYITSIAPATGKTAVAIGLGRWLQSKNKKVGYFKPVSAAGPGAADPDAEFAREALGLQEAAASLSAVAAQGAGEDVVEQIRQAYAAVSKGKDVTVVEGLSEASAASSELARLVGAKVVLVVRYSADLTAEQVASAAGHFKGSLLGVVLNAVPASRVSPVHDKLVAALQGQGIKVLGILPEDRALFTVSVAELARHIEGKVLNCQQVTGELVENIMVGAMCIDPGPLYFGRRGNKAVVTRGDRPDVQMAALETPTRCIVLSGGTQPMPVVQRRADLKKVALVSVPTDTLSTVAKIEEVFSSARFRQPRKLGRLDALLRENLDLDALKQELGIKG